MPTNLNITAAEVERHANGDSEKGLLSLAFAAGRVRATVTSARTGAQIPVKLTCKRRRQSGSGWELCLLREAERIFVDQPLGGDRGSSPIGTLYPADPARGGKHAGAFFYATNVDPARVWAARFVLEAAAGREVRWEQAELDVGNHCVLCGRELNRAESIRRMMGPDCYERATGAVGVEGRAHERGEQFAEDLPAEAAPGAREDEPWPAETTAAWDAVEERAAAMHPAKTGEQIEAEQLAQRTGSLAFAPAVAEPAPSPAPQPDPAPEPASAAAGGLISLNPGESAAERLAALDQNGAT